MLRSTLHRVKTDSGSCIAAFPAAASTSMRSQERSPYRVVAAALCGGTLRLMQRHPELAGYPPPA